MPLLKLLRLAGTFPLYILARKYCVSCFFSFAVYRTINHTELWLQRVILLEVNAVMGNEIQKITQR